MKTISVIIVGTILLILSGCSGGRYIESTKAADSAFLEGDFTKALEYSEQIIKEVEGKGKQASGNTYTMAGVSAFELGDFSKSLNYLLRAQQQEYSEENLYLYLSWNYRHIDNLSKEITSLETYMEKYPLGKETGIVRERLFQTCVESENFELAQELWTQMDSSSRKDITNLEIYLNLNRAKQNDSICNSVAAVILDRNPENEPALSWLAEYYYQEAEYLYQAQMKAYKENRTRKQYAILLKEFKQVTADFQKSRDYFLKLYKLYPNPEYARYLSNIYTRLEDETKANYYKNRAN